MSWPTDWIVPDWPVPASVRAVFTTRHGGVSVSPFDSFNLGDHVRDEALAVGANRAQLAECLGARPVFLNQVHGTEVLQLSADAVDASVADACVASAPGLACTIMVADCLPVLFAHRSGAVVGAAHAGWRGLAGSGPAAASGAGVLETVFQAFAQAVQSQTGAGSLHQVAAQTLVWLGPCIGPDAFEVGVEVREAFVRHRPEAERCFTRIQPAAETGAQKYLANLSALARLRLAAMGLDRVFGNDGSSRWCTVSTPSRFFSHRRDALRLGSTGRMAACIWLG